MAGGSYSAQYIRTSEVDSFRPSYQKSEKKKWELKITFSQMLIFWAVSGVLMILVFLFGFYSGREQGVNSTLAEYGEQSVRLPVAKHIFADIKNGAEGQNEGQQMRAASQLLAAETDSKVLQSKDLEKKIDQKKEEVSFDFSASKPEVVKASSDSLKMGQTTTGIGGGFSGKPALEIFKSDAALSQVANKNTQKESVKSISTDVKTDKQVKTKEVDNKSVNAALVKTGWYAQVASTLVEKDAKNLVSKLNDKGLLTVLESAKIKNQTYYRVLVGPYGEKKDALSGKDKAVASKLVMGDPFLKYVR